MTSVGVELIQLDKTLIMIYAKIYFEIGNLLKQMDVLNELNK